MSLKLPTKSKSLYTAILYEQVPDSTASSAKGEGASCTTYMKRLTREHLARASMEEVESSKGSSDTEAKAQAQERVVRLKDKVRKAYSECNGNPADGRWTFVHQLLKLNTTRGGRHWMGVRVEGKAPEIPKDKCIIPKSSQQWLEMERQLKEAEKVKKKVERWITTAEFEPLTPDTPVVQEEESTPAQPETFKPKSQTLNSQPTTKVVSTKKVFSTGSKLGFSVIKRSGTLARNKPKDLRREPSPGPPPSKPTDTTPVLNVDNAERNTNSTFNFGHSIFPSPSFASSQLHTSTPKSKRVPQAREPSPILFDSALISPPRPQKTYGSNRTPLRSNTSFVRESSPPVLPDTTTNQQNKKRVRSPSPSELYVSKRPRNAVEGDQKDVQHRSPLSDQNHDQDDLDPHPTTLPKRDLPHLVALLASNKLENVKSIKRYRASRPHTILNDPSGIISKSSSGLDSEESGNGQEQSAIKAVPVEDQAFHIEIEKVQLQSKSPLPTPQIASDNAAAISHPLIHDSPQEVDILIEKDLTSHAQPNEEITLTSEYDKQKKETIPVPEPDESNTEFTTNHLENGDIFEAPSIEDEPSVVEVILVEASRLSIAPESPQPHPPSSLPTPETQFSQLSSLSLQSKGGSATYNLYGLDVDTYYNPSPAKSLSSLAVSDSESEEEKTVDQLTIRKDLLRLDFNPRITSTQKSGSGGLGLDTSLNTSEFNIPPPESSQLLLGVGWSNDKLQPTSQLQAEVDSQIDELDKFMEADLGYDSSAF